MHSSKAMAVPSLDKLKEEGWSYGCRYNAIEIKTKEIQ